MLYRKGYTSRNIGPVQIGLNELQKSHKNGAGRQEGVVDLGDTGGREVNMNKIHRIKISGN